MPESNIPKRDRILPGQTSSLDDLVVKDLDLKLSAADEAFVVGGTDNQLGYEFIVFKLPDTYRR